MADFSLAPVKILWTPTAQIIALLIAERDKLTKAIEALSGPTKRRGRPPKNPAVAVATAAVPTPAKGKKRRFSAAQREAAAERMAKDGLRRRRLKRSR